MTITSPRSTQFLIAFPFLSLTANAAGANAAPANETKPQLTAAEAQAETQNILTKLAALQGGSAQPVVPVNTAENRTVIQAKTKPKTTDLFSELPAENQSNNANIMSALQAIQTELAEQKKLIFSQETLIRKQNEKIRQLELHNQLVRAAPPPETPFALSQLRGTGIQQDQLAAAVIQPDNSPDGLPDGPVGEAPPEAQNIERKVEAVPEGQGVLTPQGQFVLDPSIEYTRSSTNRLVFRGIELIPGIQIGAIEASDADRDTLIGTFAMRYGLTSRLEIEGRVPLLYRKDRIQVVQQRDEQIVREIGLEETDIGDVEFALRYQLNRPKAQNPIWVAGLRVKTDTGKSPYEIPFDGFGVATGLATGSGFWGIQPSMSFLLPSDPVVIYGGLGYLWNIERDIDRIVGDVLVGTVDPGDAVNASIGFGFALNPRFSFSLGYRHNYIFSTMTELGDAVLESNDIQVGSLNFGMSYRLTEKQSMNLGFQFGVTEDAPDVSIVLRMPLRF